MYELEKRRLDRIQKYLEELWNGMKKRSNYIWGLLLCRLSNRYLTLATGFHIDKWIYAACTPCMLYVSSCLRYSTNTTCDLWNLGDDSNTYDPHNNSYHLKWINDKLAKACRRRYTPTVAQKCRGRRYVWWRMMTMMIDDDGDDDDYTTGQN